MNGLFIDGAMQKAFWRMVQHAYDILAADLLSKGLSNDAINNAIFKPQAEKPMSGN